MLVPAWQSSLQHHFGSDCADESVGRGAECAVYRVPVVAIAALSHLVHDEHDTVTAIFTVVLALSTLFLWDATRRLWISGETQIKETRKAVAASERSAVAAQDALELARSNSERQLRAYVHIGKVVFDPCEIAPDKGLKFVVHLRNGGRTPAYFVSMECDCRISDGKDHPDWAADPQLGRITISPRGRAKPTVEFPAFEAEDCARFNSGKSSLFLSGRIAYRDSFEKQRITKFRYVSVPNMKDETNPSRRMMLGDGDGNSFE